jgi:hypothetical protein
MKRFAITWVLLLFIAGAAFSQNRSDNHEVKRALRVIKSDFKALKKLGTPSSEIKEQLLKCGPRHSKENPCASCALQNILISRVCYNLTLINERLPYANLNKKKLLQVIATYKELGIADGKKESDTKVVEGKKVEQPIEKKGKSDAGKKDMDNE